MNDKNSSSKTQKDLSTVRVGTSMKLRTDVHFALVKMSNDENRGVSNLIETILMQNQTIAALMKAAEIKALETA